MEHEKECVALGMKNESGGGDVSRDELGSRKRSGSVSQKLDDQLAAFFVLREFGHEFPQLARVDQTLSLINGNLVESSVPRGGSSRRTT